MHYLVDGYNLLHVTNVFVDAVGAKSLERLHAAFLNFLATSLLPDECKRTTVVFDAKGRRAGSRRTVQHAGITVHYAARTEDADTLIAELIRENHAPRQLIVVSSDHQVQRAARRRRAKIVESSDWYREWMRRRREQPLLPEPTPSTSTSESMPEDDPGWWLQQFDEKLLKEMDADANPFGVPRTKKGTTET